MKITVFGAGNGAIAGAAYFSLKGHAVTICNRTAEKLKIYESDPHIHIAGGYFDETDVAICAVEHDPVKAIVGAELIVVALPVTGQGWYADAIAGVLGDGQPILLSPGHTCGALLFRERLRRGGYRGSANICEMSTLPCACRLNGERTIEIYRMSDKVLIAATDPDCWSWYTACIPAHRRWITC